MTEDRCRYWHRVCCVYTALHALLIIPMVIVCIILRDMEYVGLLFAAPAVVILNLIIQVKLGIGNKSLADVSKSSTDSVESRQIVTAALAKQYSVATNVKVVNENAEVYKTGMQTYSRSWSSVGITLVTALVWWLELGVSEALLDDTGITITLIWVGALILYYIMCLSFRYPAGKWQKYNRILVYGEDSLTSEGYKRVETVVTITQCFVTVIVLGVAFCF